MSLTQLEYFVAVAETGSVTRAARRCAVSQPPLTRQLRALEAELEAQLFERRPRGMALTLAGSRLLEHARAVLALIAATPSVVQSPPTTITVTP
jgi:LysR family transcriptional regulator, benzoate and cis,cis-muconate-responsive activator of ben and cat genes